MKKRIMAMAFAAVMALTLLAGCSSKEKFVVGLDDSFPPMGFRDENNEIVGFDIDLAKEVCKEMGVEVSFQPIDWDAKEMELESGNIACVWNGMTITPEREEKMLLSKPYLENDQIICIRPDSDIKAKGDLKGKKVGLQSGSSADDALMKDDISKEVGEIIRSKDNVTALLDLKTGGLDAVVLDAVVANYYVTLEPDNYKVLEESLQPEQYAVGFKKGNTELLDKFTKAFDKVVKNGKAAEISNKWFGKDILIKD